MDYSYYLVSTSGIDVIVIPELDCRINIVDPVKEGIDPTKGTRILYARVSNKKLAFQAVGPNCPEGNELAKAIRWYSNQKHI